ncbi:FtsX-like permease family protein [uncultured Bacteroides sp.]|uniref:ABC transporter permease n=1 Tax=uncultured Bacteroides sp. TaxID=162156 RepID=UPI00261EEEF3|nr:FtsX-like permease family protein [uncultured Bacteroides sp.]
MKFTLKSLAYSLVIALPLSIYGIHLINGWLKLENSTPWWVLLIAFAVVIVISLGSVWLISRKITHENPVNNLKT